MADQVVTLRITADGKVAVQAVDQVASASRRMGADVQQGGQRAAQGLQSASQSAKVLDTSAAGARTQLLGMVAAAGGVLALAKAGISAADSYANINAQLRMATRSQAEYAIAQKETFAISQRTSSELASTVMLYARMSSSTREYNLTQRELLALTESINQTFAIGSVGAAQQSSAVTQLTQAFAGGVLRAEEYNAILDASQSTMQAIADGMGLTLGQLRAQVVATGVPVQQIIAALQNQAGVINDQFAVAAMTAGRAWTQFSNQLLKSVGELAETTGGTQFLVSVLALLSGNLGTAVLAIGAVAVAHGIAAGAAAIQAAAQRSVAATALAEAEAQVVKARAMVAVTGSVSALTAAEIRLAQAQVAATAAGVGKIGMLGRMGNSLLALAGGPVGVFVLALAGIGIAIYAGIKAEEDRKAAWEAGMKESAQHVDELLERVRALNAESGKSGGIGIGDQAGAVKTLSDVTSELAARRAELQAKTIALNAAQDDLTISEGYAALGMDSMGLASDSARATVTRLQAEVDAASKAVDDLGGAAGDLGPKVASAVPGVEALETAIKGMVSAAKRGDLEGAFDAIIAGIKGVKQANDQLAADKALEGTLATWTTMVGAAQKKLDEHNQTTASYRKELLATALAEANASDATGRRAKEVQALFDQGERVISQAGRIKTSTREQTNDSADYVQQLLRQVATYGMTEAATSRYELSLKKLTPEQRALAAAAIDTLEAWERYATGLKPAYDAIEQIMKGSADLDEQLAQGRDVLAGLDDTQVRYNASLREANRLAEAAMALGPMTAEQQKAMEERLRKIAEIREQDNAIQAREELTRDVLEAEREQLRQSEQAWGDWADAVFDAVSDSGNVLDNLLDNLKSVVTQMLREWFRTSVIGTFSGNGEGGFNLSSLLSMFGGGGDSGGGAGGLSSMFSSNSWVQYGQSLWQGFFGAGTTAGSALVSNSPLLYTAPTQGFSGAGSLGWDGSSGLGFGGDFGGGTGAYGAGGGSASAGASGAAAGAYAAGAIAVAVIINGMFEKQGWHIENGFDNGAVNRLAMSGMPIVDVSALAQYGVKFADSFLQKLGLDKTWASMLSGSSITARLFGNQDPKIQRQGYEFEFGGGEATGNAYADWKAKGGLFSSSKWGTEEQDLSAEMAGQIQAFWDSVRAAMNDAAATLGTDVPAMISASFKSTYDKDGKLISEVGTILGRTYNESFEIFQQRILAENIIATVGVGTPQTETITGYQTTPRHRDRDTGQWVDAVTTPIMSVISEASAIAERWRGNAEDLLAGAQFLLAAQTQMNQGNGLLGDDATLTQVADFIESVRTGNESLIDTYARVAASVALVDQAFGLAGITTSQTREELVRWSADLVNNLGGIESAAAFFQDFANRYYTDAERTGYTLQQTTAAATTQFTAAGLDLGDFTGEGGNAAMRALVEGALASGNAELAAQYLRLAAALGMVSDAQAAYNAAIGEAAGPVAQTADQLAAVNEILDANAWELATAGMSAANLAIRDINKAFEDQRIQLLANAATTEQLTLLEDQRLQALQQQYDAFVAQFAPQADQSSLAGQTTTIRAWEADQIAQAEAYAEAAGMEGVAASDLANIHAEASRRIAEAQATFQAAYDDFIATFAAPTAEPVNVAEAVEQTRAWEQRQIERANELAIAAGMQGAAEEDLALIRARALDVIAAATAEFERQYQDFVAQFRPDAALPTGANASTLAEAQAQADAWEQSMIDQANAYAIAAGREGAAAEDLANIHQMAADAVTAAADRMAAALIDYNDFIDGIRRANGEFTQFQQDSQDATRWYDDAVARATELAHAAGLAGIAEGDLAAIEVRAAQMRAAAYRVLEASAAGIVGQLQGPASGSLAGINAQIATLESGVGSMGGAVEDTAQRWLDAIRGVRDFLDGMLLNTSTTTLTPEQQLAEAQAQYEALLAAAQNGDANAAAQLPAMAQQYLDLARGFYSSGDQYQAIFDAIRNGLQGIAGMPNPGSNGGPVTVGPSPELIALYEERDALLAQQEAEHRAQLNQQLLGYLADMAGSNSASLSELAASIGLNMRDFVTGLGIDLDNMTVGVALQLGELAGSLRRTVFDLADSVGVSLGDLADRQSLLNQAVQATILGLPTESADALQPYLDAVADATTEADANAAIQALIDQINLQPDDIRSQLAPYFEGILPASSLDQLDYLGEIATTSRQMQDYAREQVEHLLRVASSTDATTAELFSANGTLSRIADNLAAANSAAGVPSYAVGTGYVPSTGLANIHEGEAIIPAPFASWLRSNGFPTVSESPSSGGADAAVASLAEEFRVLRREVREGLRQVAMAASTAGTVTAEAATRSGRDTAAAIKAMGRQR